VLTSFLCSSQGGFGAASNDGSTPNTPYVYQDVSCGLAARAQLAHPRYFGPGAVHTIYSLVLPPVLVLQSEAKPSISAVFLFLPLSCAIAVTAAVMGLHLFLLRGLWCNDAKVIPMSRVLETSAQPPNAVTAASQHPAGLLHLVRAAAVATSSSEDEVARGAISATVRAPSLVRYAGLNTIELPSLRGDEQVKSMPQLLSIDASALPPCKLPVDESSLIRRMSSTGHNGSACNTMTRHAGVEDPALPLVRFGGQSSQGDVSSHPVQDHGAAIDGASLRLPGRELCEVRASLLVYEWLIL